MDVRNLVAQHDALARRFKVYEQRVGELPPVEVLNELRYALRAAVEFIALKDAPTSRPEREQDLIARMDHALKCGYHDLIDGLAIELVGFIDRLITKYPKSSYEVAGGKIADIRHDISEVESVISESRGNPDSRATVYEQELYDKWFDRLVDHRRYLVDTAKPLIARRQDELDREGRSLRDRQWVMLLVGALVGALVSLLITSVWDWLQ